MDTTYNVLYNSLSRYFNRLKKFGYVPYSQVDKILVMLLIDDIISGKFIQLVPEDDYRILTECMYCLYGTTCLIPYPKYVIASTSNRKNQINFRITDKYGIIRYSEGANIRVV